MAGMGPVGPIFLREGAALLISTVIYGGSIWISEKQTLVSRVFVMIAENLAANGRHMEALNVRQAALHWDELWISDEGLPIFEAHYANLAVLAGILGRRQLRSEYTQCLADITYPQTQRGVVRGVIEATRNKLAALSVLVRRRQLQNSGPPSQENQEKTAASKLRFPFLGSRSKL